MKKMCFLLLPALLVFMVQGFLNAASNNVSHKTFLLRDAVIVLPDSKKGDLRLAAKELAYYAGKITGKKIPLVNEETAAKKKAPKIYIGCTTKMALPDLKKCEYDGYWFKQQKDGGLLIIGSSDKGTEFGVYGFLQDLCGVRFYLPESAGTFVPENKLLAIPLKDALENPFFKQRHFVTVSAYDRAWLRHNRLLNRYPTSHGLYHIINEKYAKSHPEYFAYSEAKKKRLLPGQDGRRSFSQQPCMTNKEVIQLVADYAINYFRKNPDKVCLQLGANDSTNYCQCQDCRKIAGNKKEFNDMGVVSDSRLALYFYNKIAEKVFKVFPDKYIGIIGYNSTRSMPEGMTLHPNIVMSVLEFPQYFFGTESENYTEMLKRKKSVPSLAVSGWRYGTGFLIPNFPMNLEERFLDFCRDNKFFGMHTELGANWIAVGIKDYLFAQKMWDPDKRSKDMLEEFCRNMFGAGAQDMIKFYELGSKTWESQKIKFPHAAQMQRSTAQFNVYTEKICRQLLKHLEDAHKKAGSKIPGKAWLTKQLSYYRLVCDIQKLCRYWKEKEPDTLQELTSWCIKFEKMRRNINEKFQTFREANYNNDMVNTWYPAINNAYLLLTRCHKEGNMREWERFLKAVGPQKVLQWLDQNKDAILSAENKIKNPTFNLKKTPYSRRHQSAGIPEYWQYAQWGGDPRPGSYKLDVKNQAVEMTGIRGKKYSSPFPVITQKIPINKMESYLFIFESMYKDGEADLMDSWVSQTRRPPHSNNFKPFAFFVTFPKNTPKNFSYTLGVHGYGIARYRNPKFIPIPSVPEKSNVLTMKYEEPPVLPEPIELSYPKGVSRVAYRYFYEGSYALKIRIIYEGKGNIQVTAFDSWGRTTSKTKTLFTQKMTPGENISEFTYYSDYNGVNTTNFTIRAKRGKIKLVEFIPVSVGGKK